MKIVWIVNAAADEKIHQDIEKFAFFGGFLTCSPEEYLQNNVNLSFREGKSGIVLIDRRGMEKQPKDIINILYMECPIILIPVEEKEVSWIIRKKEKWYEEADYPFSHQVFQRILSEHMEGEKDSERVMSFGQLQIDRGRRLVSMGGRKIHLRRFEYEILLILVGHVGEVVTREYINQSLPPRRRSSARNVDVHIKRIREEADMGELIQCIRKVGYCIPADVFYRRLSLRQ